MAKKEQTDPAKEQSKAMIKVSQALEAYEKADLALIKDTVAKGATDAELSLFLYTAQMRGLNPLARQIHLVKRKQKVDGADKEVAVIQTGIDGFRLIANRTGQYAPSPKPTHFEYDSKGQLVRATFYGIKIIGGQAFEFSASARFKEYAQYFGGRLGNMWAKMPETMLEKCAEAKLLRKGFPEELSGLYTDEEMQQADITTIHEAEAPEKDTGSPFDDPEVVEGEIISRDEEVPEDTRAYAYLLQKCPEHDAVWEENRYGKLYHKEGDSFCNFSQQIKPVLESRGTLAGFKTKEDFTDWCKKNFDGRTWSKLTETEQVDALELIDKIVEANTSDNPVVKAAIKEGAVVTGTEKTQGGTK